MDSRDREPMSDQMDRLRDASRVLLCFDGSDDAAAAIAKAGELLSPRGAVVLTVWEPVAVWEPYDPATILSAPVSKLASNALGLDEIADDRARENMDSGVARRIRGAGPRRKRQELAGDLRRRRGAGRRAYRAGRPRPVTCPVGAPRQRLLCGRRARETARADRPA
jgi:hypothetical protein